MQPLTPQSLGIFLVLALGACSPRLAEKGPEEWYRATLELFTSDLGAETEKEAELEERESSRSTAKRPEPDRDVVFPYGNLGLSAAPDHQVCHPRLERLGEQVRKIGIAKDERQTKTCIPAVLEARPDQS